MAANIASLGICTSTTPYQRTTMKFTEIHKYFSRKCSLSRSAKDKSSCDQIQSWAGDPEKWEDTLKNTGPSRMPKKTLTIKKPEWSGFKWRAALPLQCSFCLKYFQGRDRKGVYGRCLRHIIARQPKESGCCVISTIRRFRSKDRCNIRGCRERAVFHMCGRHEAFVLKHSRSNLCDRLRRRLRRR